MLEIEQHETRQRTIVQLQEKIRKWERSSPQTPPATYSTGCMALDALLPSQGVRQGSLVEWVGETPASGAGTLSLVAAREVCPAGQPIVLVDPGRQIYPSALSALGFDLARLVIIRPGCERETLWVCEEVLRCEAVGLMWAELEHRFGTAFRRLQLAAEESAGIGFLLRS